MRERHGHALGGSEAVFAIENHAVAAIEKDHRGAGTVVFALMHHQVRVGHFDGNFRAFTADSVEERGTNVHVERVAEFIGARDAAGFDSGGKVAGVVAAKAAAAKRAEQVLQSLEAQKIDGLARLARSEEHTSELQSPDHLVCRLLLEKKKHTKYTLQYNRTILNSSKDLL